MNPVAVRCGEIPVSLLPPSPSLTEELLRSYVNPVEIERANAIRHPQRRFEFLAARALVHQVIPLSYPIISASDGVVTWPNKMTGSISHKDGIAACTVVPKGPFNSVGIDLECPDGFKVELAPRICDPNELALLAELSEATGWSMQQLATLAFAFKEAIFKCHFPIGRRWFYFHDAEIIGISHQERRIAARLKLQTSDLTPVGFVAEGNYIFATIADRNLLIASCCLKQPLSS